MKLDPKADFALPLLLLLFTALGISVVVGAVAGLGLTLLAPAGLLAFLFALESHLFTTFFAVRTVDPPAAMRVVEVVLMAVLAKLAASLPVTGSLAEALLDVDHIQTWAGFLLLAWVWRRGQRIAEWAGALNPAITPVAEAGEIAHSDAHTRAYEALYQQVLAQLALTVLLPGLLAWASGHFQLITPWITAGLLVSAILGALTLLVAAQLRRLIGWMAERMTPPAALFGGWTGQGVSLLLLPLLFALLLPALPRVPVERLLGKPTIPALPRQAQPPSQPDSGNGMGPMLERLAERLGPTVDLSWLFTTLKWIFALAAILLALWLIRRAAREWRDRTGQGALAGLRTVLSALAAWYGVLLRGVVAWLSSGVQQAAATSAAAVGGWLERSSGLSRYLPDWERLPADPRAAVRQLFRRLERGARRQGVVRPPGLTAGEFADLLARETPAEADQLAELTAIYQKARYSEEPVGPEAVSQVRQAWSRVLRGLRHRPRKH